MAVSPISGAGFMNYSSGNRYSVLSIHGNPRSLEKVNRINDNSNKSNPLIVIKENEESIGQIDNLESVKQTTSARVNSSDFADIIKKQEEISGESESNISDYGNYLKEMINRMMVGVNTEIPSVDFR